jgi:hypothetical protein
VQVYHHMGGVAAGPGFSINNESDFNVQTGENANYLFLRSGKLEMRIYKSSAWRIDYLYDGGLKDNKQSHPAYPDWPLSGAIWRPCHQYWRDGGVYGRR